MRTGQSLATLLCVALFSTTSLMGQQQTPPAANAQTTSMHVNGSVWIKNPFSERDLPATQQSDRAPLQQTQKFPAGLATVNPKTIVNQSQRSPIAHQEQGQPSAEVSTTNPLRPSVTANPAIVRTAQSTRTTTRREIPQRTLNHFSSKVPSHKEAHPVPSSGPLDRYVQKTSGTEVVDQYPATQSQTVVPVKPVHADTNTQRSVSPTSAPKVTVEQMAPMHEYESKPVPARPASVLINREYRQPRETVKLEPYAHTPYGDPTSHIHEEARIARENFDPSLCNRKPANNPDISGCYDEWGNFCRPKRMDWECNCRQFPRREGNAGCTHCQSSRRGLVRGPLSGHGRLAQGLRNLACGCQGECDGQCNTKGCDGLDCTVPNCECRKGLKLFGTGLFKRGCGDDCDPGTSPNLGLPRFDFGNAFAAMPKGIANHSCVSAPNLFAALGKRSGDMHVNTYTPDNEGVCSECLTERVVNGTRCNGCLKRSGAKRTSLFNFQINKGCCSDCGVAEEDCNCAK